MSLAYYSEHDEFCAGLLRNLITAGHIAPGDVDERDIRDIKPSDLAGYTQCHFFAGIGIWSAALREAGIGDDEPIWTGSCPCQPFSAAGQKAGFADERHLWPAFFHLIEQLRPARVLGEQVASPDGLRWLDLVQDDLEGAGYACGAADTCAAGAGVGFAESEEGQATLEWIRGAVLSCHDSFLAAELSNFAAWAGGSLGYGPAHIRQRLYWMANAEPQHDRGVVSGSRRRTEPANCCPTSLVANADGGNASPERQQRSGQYRLQPQGSGAGGLVQSFGAGLEGHSGHGNDLDQPGRVAEEPSGPASAPGSDWIICTDGKARPTQPSLLPLAHAWQGPSRLALLRAAGNALCKAQAVQFIRASYAPP